MYCTVYLPLVVAGLLALCSPVIATRLPPATATKVLTLTALVSATTSLWGLLLLAGTVAAQQPDVARYAHWSPLRLVATDPVPRPVGVLAMGLVVVAAARSLLVVVTQLRERAAGRALRRGSRSQELIVLPDLAPRAFAIPGREGRIAVSVGMLRALDARERRVLLAHERSHLRHRHDLYTAVVALAAATNPLLVRTRRDTVFCCERWADEDAGADVRSRPLAARALAHAALAALASPARQTLAFQGLRVPHRLAALAAPAPRARPTLAVAYSLLAGASVLAAGDATMAMIRLLHTARG